MNKNKMTPMPPKKSIQDFILDAEKTGGSNNKKARNLPWNDSTIRHDVQKAFTVRLTEEYLLKIKFISELTNKSQQKIVRELIYEKIDQCLKEMGYDI